MNFKFSYIIFSLVLFSLLWLSQCSYKERIRIEPNKIWVKYEHQLKDGSSDFTQTLDVSIFHNIKPDHCSNNGNNSIYCLKWGDFAQFSITQSNKSCENYEFKTEFDEPLKVMFNISGIHLYGGAEVADQKWPTENIYLQNDSFVSKEKNSEAVLEPYWLTSSGFYLHVEDSVPLFITINKKEGILTLIANRQPPYIRGKITNLTYKICKYENARIAHEHGVVNSLGKPSGVPDYKMIELPIWSTWAKYKSNISESTILEFAELINRYKLPNSQIEIDDMWETCYGSLTVDPNRFPNMKGLVSQLKNMGFRVTIWVHPFINLDCTEYFKQGSEFGYFVSSTNNSVLTSWWNGRGAYIDFTNLEAVNWYQTRLKKLQAETGIDSFKFDAGESSWSPQVPIFKTMADDHPETILKAYVNAVSAFGSMIEVRSARGTQHHPIFVRMMDRESTWSGRLGMDTLIPELLHMNIIGYPFVLPDMIGGNGYGHNIVTEEMFIRWLQINVFMPSLQFSYPPWDFGEKVVNTTKKYIDLHSIYANKIYELMKESTKSGIPINLPIWWIDPADPVSYTIDSEFLLGEDLLVAPVIEQGAKSRNIYLPKGVWKDETKKHPVLIKGPIWLYNYPADLETLPYFLKISSSTSSIMPVSLFVATPCVILLMFYK